MPAEKWQLLGFMDALRAWMRYDPPPNDLLVKVADFGAQLEHDPASQAVQEHANFFYREVPGTVHDGRIVSITFTVEHRPVGNGEVRCQDVGCVPYPDRELLRSWPPSRHHS